MDTREIITAIIRGDVDDDLQSIEDALHERRKTASRVQFHTLKPGDKVKLKNLRPQYLVGAPATVVDKNVTRIRIELDHAWLDAHPQAKSRWSGVITAAADMLEPA